VFHKKECGIVTYPLRFFRPITSDGKRACCGCSFVVCSESNRERVVGIARVGTSVPGDVVPLNQNKFSKQAHRQLVFVVKLSKSHGSQPMNIRSSRIVWIFWSVVQEILYKLKGMVFEAALSWDLTMSNGASIKLKVPAMISG